MKPIHVAVFGAGAFGRHHVRHLASHPLVARVSVVDPERCRARAIAGETGAHVADEDVVPDAAVVAVPTEAHHAVAARLLRRGIGVFVEKPLAATDGEASALVELAARTGAVLQVGHIERFAPAFEALRTGVRGVRHVSVRRHNPPRATAPAVDVVLDLMIHDADLAMALAGGTPPAAVTAVAVDGTGQEAATARLAFASGIVAELSASRLSPVTERTIIVHAANGVWRADLVHGRLDRCRNGTVAPVPLPDRADKLAAELDEFVRAVVGEAVPRVDGAAGAEALAVANRIRTALRSPSFQLSA
jgi:predicted dehydrogenase